MSPKIISKMSHTFRLALIFTLIATTVGCSVSQESLYSWIRLDIKPQSKIGQNLNFVFEPPASINAFQCLALNVTGEGVFKSDGSSPTASEMNPLLQGSQCSYRGAVSQFVDISGGGILQVKVPSGRQRLIQVQSYLTQNGCPTDKSPLDFFAGKKWAIRLSENLSFPFEVGSKVVDLFRDQTVSIDNQYSQANPRGMGPSDCPDENLPAPTASPSPAASPSPTVSPGPAPLVFIDSSDTAAGFASGVKSGVTWVAASGWLEQTAMGTTGTYTSRIFDAGKTANWTNLAWLPFDRYKKGLPDGKTSEPTYPGALNSAQMGTNALLIHFDLNNAGVLDFLDKSGNAALSANACIVGDCPGIDPSGVFGSAVNFDGTKAYQIAPNVLNLSGSDYTISVWVKMTDTAKYGIFGRADVPANNDYDYDLSIDYNLGSNKPIFKTQKTAPVSIVAPALISAEWHHLVIRRSVLSMSIYLDGAHQDSQAILAANDTGAGGPLTYIGYTASTNTKMKGSMDELAVWQTALSVTDIEALTRRGAADISFQVQTCNVPDCSDAGAIFVGPSGTSATFYSEANNSVFSPPNLALTGLSPARYFRYKASLLTSYLYLPRSPRLMSISVTAQP